MYGKVKIAGYPVHPMLVAFPVACYTGTAVLTKLAGPAAPSRRLNLTGIQNGQPGKG